jgi:hypothetical protein
MMQRTKDQTTGDLAWPTKCKPSNVRGIHTDERITAAEREAADAAAIQIGFEHGTTESRIAPSDGSRAKLKAYTSKDVGVQVGGKAGLKQQTGRNVNQARLVAEDLKRFLAKAGGEIVLAKEAWPGITTAVVQLGALRCSHVQAPNAVCRKPAEGIGRACASAGWAVKMKEPPQGVFSFDVWGL